MVKPQCYFQAAKNERLIEAMKLEINVLEDNKTWEVIDLPQGKISLHQNWCTRLSIKTMMILKGSRQG